MKFVAEDDKLMILLHGWEVFASLKRKIVVPRSCIRSLDWQPEFVHRGSLIRLVGLGLPGALYAGRYIGNGLRYFIYMQKPRGISWVSTGQVSAPNILDIETIDFRYKRLLLSCSPEIGPQLVQWWGSTSSPMPPSDAVPE